ncbi:pyridoxamine 5'-phosphate oxidase family protein [Candidatus Poribacteria bacterium]|nr:pyridoxamine 5'-phosphate oxidase family protein [Candidatus Poribacteria bacterium]
MKLREYFDQTTGRGVLATADAEGKVDAAVYAKPHFIEDETIAFIMADRLTHKNLQANPYAVYLFMEAGEKYVGKRLYLSKFKETQDSKEIDSLLRKKEYRDAAKYLVYFRIDKVLPLIGDNE